MPVDTASPQPRSVLDILNSVAAGDPLAGMGAPSSVPAPLSPALVPSGDAYARSVAPKGPTLGPQDDYAGAAGKVDNEPASGGTNIGDTLTLPPRNSSNSFDPSQLNTPEETSVHPGFLDKLKQFASGALGEPGLTGPNSTPASKGAAVASILGRIGTAGALAAGTPEQKSLAVEQEQIPLKIGQMQAEAAYRRGMLGINQQNANTKGQVAATGAKTEQDKYAAGDAAMGLPEGTTRMTAEAAQQNADIKQQLEKIKEAQMNGETYVTPEAARAVGREDLANKSLGALAYQQQITNPLNIQLKAAGGTKTVDLGADGVYGYNALTQRIHRLGDSPSVARGDAMLKRTQLPVNDNQGNVLGWVNPQTKTFTSVSDINGAAPGAPSLSAAEGGSSVIPPKPTSSVMSRGQVAQTILPQIPVIQKEVETLASKIGPGAGRWTDFWVNKAGANDPAFAGLNQDLQLYATAIGLAHFGASMPEGFVKDMMNDFGTAQSPEDLQSRIEHAQGWVQGYASRVGGGKGTSEPTFAAPTVPAGENKSNSGGQGSMYQFPDGTQRLVTSDKAARAEALGAKRVK